MTTANTDTAVTASPPVAPPLDQRSVRAERRRIADISLFEKRVGGDFVRHHIEAGTHIDKVREEALARIMAEDD